MILISLTLIVLQAMSGINSYGTPSGQVKFFCSKVGKPKKNWKDAKKTCNDAGLQMAMPRTKAELDQLRELCNVHPLPHVRRFWTKKYSGGNRIHDLLVWIGGSASGKGKDYKMFKYENGEVVPRPVFPRNARPPGDRDAAVPQQQHLHRQLLLHRQDIFDLYEVRKYCISRK